jgi:hypothetical protein
VVSLLLLSAALLGLLIWSGVSLLQLCSPLKRIPFLFYLPYGWAVGTLLLYGIGGVVVRIGIFRGIWHFIVLATAILIIPAAYWVRRRAKPVEEVSLPRLNFAYYEWIVIALILVKVAGVFYLEMTNPIIDGDAAHNALWVGLAKVIHQDGTLLASTPYTSFYRPSLLPAWIGMFLPRWHDNLISLPWLLTYLSIIALSFIAGFRTTKNRFAALILAYLFSSIPLSIVHAIRPGYADLIVSYFFLIGITIITFTFTNTRIENRMGVGLALVSALGAFWTKNEGIVWAGWMAWLWLSYYLHFKKNVGWGKLFAALGVLIGACYLAFFAFAEFIRTHTRGIDARFEQLFQQSYDPAAAKEFFWSSFMGGSFHLWWWLLICLLVLTLIKRKVPADLKAWSLYLVVPLILVFYLAAFTANVRYTFQQTNVSRVLLQICGLLFPYYCIFQKEVLADSLSASRDK